MKYLKIANPANAVIPIECFVTLGVGTSGYDGGEDVNGMFSSGFKLGTILLLRNGYNPIVFNNTLRIEFFTKTKTINDGIYEKDYEIVHYRLSGKDADGKTLNRTEVTSYSLEYGRHDWNAIAMALREYVSNALDRATRETGTFKNAVVEVVEENQVRAKAGEVRIFLPYEDDIEQFHQELSKRFLHFGEPYLLRQKILPKKDRSVNGTQSACVYKKGVLVRQIYGKESIFDYNLGDELALDESRNVDEYTIRATVARALSNAEPKHIAAILSSVAEGKDVWEASLDSYYLNPTLSDKPEAVEARKGNWKKALEASLGDAVLCTSNATAELVQRKGRKAKVVKADGWFKAAQSYGLPTDTTVLTEDDKLNREYLEATPDVLATLDSVWSVLKKVSLIKGKEKPQVKVFTEIMNGESQKLGFYRLGEDTAYIHKDISVGLSDMLWQVMLEEVSHYISGSGDSSRDFQDFAFRTTTAIAKLLNC